VEGEAKKTSIRLYPIDLENIESIKASGAAQDESEAIRVALAAVAAAFVKVPAIRQRIKTGRR
jgi:hypothetical protein